MAKDAHTTLEEVAIRAGVSIATASRALAGIKVRGKNQALVEKAVAELGYVPNIAARALRNDRSMTVGMVFFELTSALGMEILDALTSGLDAQGYSLFISTAQGQPDRYEELVLRFLERRVDALICVHGRGEGAALDRCLTAGIPVVGLISKAGGYNRLPLIAPSVATAAAEAVGRLRTLGHRHLGVVWPDRPRGLLNQFVRAAERDGFAVDEYTSTSAAIDPDGFLRALMASVAPPTVILANQAEAAKLLEAADRQAISIPSELSVVGIRDRNMSAPATRLGLSMLHLNPSLIGAEAAAILKVWLGEDVALTKDRYVEAGSWIEKETTAAPRFA